MVSGFSWESYAAGSDSMSLVTRHTSQALLRCGYDVTLHPWELSPFFRRAYHSVRRPVADFHQWGPAACAKLPTDLVRAIETGQGLTAAMLRQRVGIIFSGFSHINFMELRGTERKIGYFFCDFTSLPDAFVRQVNAMFDVVAVTSTFVQDTFLRAGVSVPVTVWHHGVDTAVWNFIDRRVRESFTFLFVGVAQWRKGLDVLLQAFSTEFGQGEDVRMIIKSSDWGALTPYRKRWKDARITWLHRSMRIGDLARLYAAADCLVIASRGEGFCLPGLEAMATGLPIVAHDWGGHKDYARDDLAYLVRSHGASVVVHPNFGWTSPPLVGEPDLEHLRHQMRFVFEHRGEALERGREAAAVVARDWTWEATTTAAVRDVRAVTGWEIPCERTP